MGRFYSTVLVFLLFLGSFAAATEFGKVTVRKVADGVYLFTTSSYGDVGMCGNSVAILSDDGALVFDSTALPETAAKVLAEIRKLTGKPVRYLVNSHWHWDHWGGNQVYRSEFPGLDIITHEKNLAQMLEVEPRWNDAGLKEQLPRYLEYLEKNIAAARAKGAPEAEIRDQEMMLKADRDFYNQKISLDKTYPNVTFSGSMSVRPGGREIDILHARAITIGDTYLYLPKERILIAGDILLNPFPFAIGGSYPADWLKTLEGFAALHPALIIPGHGEARSDPEFLQQTISLFREVIRLVRDAHAKGMTLEQVRESIGQQAGSLASGVGITDPEKVKEFRAYFLDVFTARAFEEQDHPLGDLPAGLPPS